MKLKPIEKQTIVITGGSSGIGLATAKMAAERGSNVIILSRDEEGMRKICDEERAAGRKMDYVVADVGEREQVRNAVQTILKRHGGFDTWYNCAGVGVYSKLEDVSDEDHERVFRTNYWGVVFGSLEALKHLKKKKTGGVIINQGSIVSDMPAPILGTYVATKHAVKGFTDSLREELIEEGAPVHISLIKPSGIHTPFGEHAKNDLNAASVVPPPLYAPEVVAQAVLNVAEKPERDVIVGGSGRGMTWLQKSMPSIADKIFSRAFTTMALDRSRPPRKSEGGFDKAGSSGEMYGDQDTFMLKSSLYTSAKTRPVKTLATVAAVGAGAAALTGWLLRPKAMGDQEPNEAESGDQPSSII